MVTIYEYTHACHCLPVYNSKVYDIITCSTLYYIDVFATIVMFVKVFVICPSIIYGYILNSLDG